MNNIGDSFLLLAVVLGLLWLARQVCLSAAPGLVRFVERLLNRLGQVMWSIPMRRFGFIGVCWFVMIGCGVAVTVATVVAVCSGDVSGAIVHLITSIVIWGMIVGTWYLTRFLARRRYTPRLLPTRERERR